MAICTERSCVHVAVRLVIVLCALRLPCARTQTDIYTLPAAQRTTWTLTNSPYIVHQDILVDEDSTLTVEAGVEVLFHNAVGLKVKGTLLTKVTI